MRRVLTPKVYATWLATFLPRFQSLHPEVVVDPSDPKLAHLDGLNLSRAWMLEGIASGLPGSDPRLSAVRALAQAHRKAGLRSVTGAHYEGGHWLGTFPVYLATQRGLRPLDPASSRPQPSRRILLARMSPNNLEPLDNILQAIR